MSFLLLLSVSITDKGYRVFSAKTYKFPKIKYSLGQIIGTKLKRKWQNCMNILLILERTFIGK
ncbi:hypothetical protein kac68v162_gp056 [Nodularia phage vB_NspS-kac68v162]|uniref:Uncharacterized protein n=2 Tax=Ravarandavirus kac68v161 TaxID=2845690 RepID=A0A482MJD5_9CAUD|nr:hypothetical protein HWC13_gp059 [Nodularia phage vB_NspS-kac68v161]QBQ73709.1 hypothetical protein kac68v161_gp059 [Nodularia phage vB_NspS-kac68v161]QBQ73904.1 hypothetical protein kac68v162_gp056 [Nodularia phage vB_NspS-kac68v162]